MIEVGSLEYKVSNKFADNVDCRHNSVWKSRFQVGARFFDIFSKGSDIPHILFRLLLESLNSYVDGQNLQYQRYSWHQYPERPSIYDQKVRFMPPKTSFIRS